MQYNSRYFTVVVWVLHACGQTGIHGALCKFSLPIRQETKRSNKFGIFHFSANYITLQFDFADS